MTQQLDSPQHVTDYRTQFFPAPCLAPSNLPELTQLVEQPMPDMSSASGAGPFLVQCNCACK